MTASVICRISALSLAPAIRRNQKLAGSPLRHRMLVRALAQASLRREGAEAAAEKGQQQPR